MYFHYRCGERITLLNDSCTAVRNDGAYDHGIVVSAEPLVNDALFEVKIDRKVVSWSGSLEIGVTDIDPLNFEFAPCASKLQSGCWIMTGNTILKDGTLLLENYGMDLNKLNQDDRVGLLRTSEGDLIIYINGEPQGVAVEGLPPVVYAVVDLYGKCVQVSITSPALREHNNDDCFSGSSMLAIDNDILNVTLGGDLSELSLSSNNSLDARMDTSISVPDPPPRHDKLRFHECCGSLVKLSNGNRTAERRRPLDEFNNGVVMTHRPLFDSELFEIRIDRLVDKWSGSIEMGITTHNPNSLVFPATMTNMRTGTIMMSGCGILTNGKGTRREYGDFNLDELSEGDRVAMMRKPNGSLHYFINGLDQGVAAQGVPSTVWGVIDLYGMTIRVSIVERDEREEQNLMTRRNTRDQQLAAPETHGLSDYYDRLTFHANCGTHAQVINNGRTAHRPNASDDFNNGVVLTSRPLKTGEMFEVRLDRVVTKWAGSIEIGVTTHSPTELEFPFTMTNVRSGTWMMTGSGIMHNGTTVLEQYGVNLDRLQVGDRVGVVRKENGLLHFFVNGEDQGTAASNIPERVYGVIDLYGQAVEATIVDAYDYGSPDTLRSSFSNTTLYSDLRFHHVHGKNVRVVNNGQTALRPRPLAEFNDAIIFSSRPLRDGELFEICLENMVDRWSGSIEIGITAVRPDDIDLPSTATDLCHDTWMLSGSSVMENGTTVKDNYPCDLDTLTTGTRLGVVRTSEKMLEFYKDGIPQGAACIIPHDTVYAVVDLYGQCAQVSIACISPLGTTGVCPPLDCCPHSDTSASLHAVSNMQATAEIDLHRFSDCHSKNITLTEGGRVAMRGKEQGSSFVFSATTLQPEEMFEIALYALQPYLAGTLCIGVTATSPANCATSLPLDYCYVTGNEFRWKNRIIQQFTPNLMWLRVGDRIGLYQTIDGCIKLYINAEEVFLNFPAISGNLYIVIDLRGSCSGVSVTSRKTPLSPITSVRMQDSLELIIEPEPTSPQELENKQLCETSSTETTAMNHFYFQENHGRNIEISCERTVAKRVASYNQGIVLVQPALTPNSVCQIVIENRDMRWQSSLMLGVIWVNPDRLNLPVTALSFKNPSYVISSDYIGVNGRKIHSNYGHRLNTLTVGSRIGIKLAENGNLQLIIDGVAEDEVTPGVTPIGQQPYAFFDLYGQCQQIKLISEKEGDSLADFPSHSTDCEKADLESHEKERSRNALSLNLASTSNELSVTINYSNIDITNHKISNCSYREDIIRFKKTLLLPNEYFLQDDPVCYCIKCYKFKNQDSDAYKDESIIGWVKFALKNLSNIQTDKWHTAYYGTKLGAIRRILDKGQPLTKDEAEWCGIASYGGDEMQVVFHPSLQHCEMTSFRIEGVGEIQAAFQLLVKPGAYSVIRDSVDWSTKETGAIVLHSLLFKFSMY